MIWQQIIFICANCRSVVYNIVVGAPSAILFLLMGFPMNNIFNKLAACAFITILLTACGSSGGGSVGVTPQCEDGTQIPQSGVCMKTCSDDSRVPETDNCPGDVIVTCIDGSEVTDTANCPPIISTEYSRDDGLRDIQAADAYAAGYYGQGVTVAVVDSGMQVTHEDLRDNIVAGYDFADDDDIINDPVTDTSPNGHGTLVGGIIAASRNGVGRQGVAPLAKLMPLKIGDDNGNLGGSRNPIQYAVSEGVKIVNHSYTANTLIAYMEGDTKRYVVLPGGFIPFTSASDISNLGRSQNAINIFDDIKTADIVNVWSSGNQGWNSETGVAITCSELTDKGGCPSETESKNLGDLVDDVSFGTVGITPYYLTGNYTLGMPSFQSVYPLYLAADNNVRNSFLGEDGSFINADESLDEIYSALLEEDNDLATMASRWLVVTALSNINHNLIASYSNGCGVAAYWCISAPGSVIRGPGASVQSDSEYYTSSGTSFSAPHASGALAVIHSVIPEMPINVAMAVLLTTATDLGEEGLDPIYGWGRINLSAAVTMAEGLRMANSGLSAVSYAELRQELPARFDYLPQRLQNVSVAIKITDNAYYNIGLADMLSTSGKAESSIGDGAAALLRPAATDSAPGFFAYGAHHSEIGLRYYGELSGFSLMADMAHLAAETDFVGGDLGALGAIDSKSNTGKLQFLRTIGGNWQLFGGYEYAALRANAGGDGLISDIGNVHADGYNIGLALGDIWRFGDQFSLSAKRETALRNGELTLRYPHAEGDFYRAFLGGEQDLQIRETTVSLRQKAATILMAGYRQPLDRQTEWATALEYNAATRAAAWSVKWQTRF